MRSIQSHSREHRIAIETSLSMKSALLSPDDDQSGIDFAIPHQKFNTRVKTLSSLYRLRNSFQRQFLKKIFSWIIALILLNCVLLDSTGFFTHFSIYIAMVCIVSFAHERIVSWMVQLKSADKFVRYNARLVLTLTWVLASTLFPPGIIRLLMTSGAIVATLGLIFTCLAPGTIIFTVSFIALIMIGVSYGFGLGSIICVIFTMATIIIAWLRRSLRQDAGGNVSMTLIHGTLLAIATFLVVSFVFTWIFLSINSFWIHSDETSKFDILRRLGDVPSLHAVRIGSISDLNDWKSKGGALPVVIKPNVCTTNSAGVRLCHNFDCLIHYVQERKATGSRQDDTSWVIQDVAYGTELVVFFFRYPYYKKGFVKSVGLRIKANSVNTLVSNGSDLRANYFTNDANYLATPQFVQFFNKITADFTGYTGGRFDVIVEDLKSAMATGVGIHVLEGNIFPLGDIEEKAAGINMKIRTIRTMMLQIWMGFVTVLGGYQSDAATLLRNIPRLVERYYQCQNYEHLWAVP